MQKEDTFYRALLEKDESFEGIFFAGIKTTGIFCRPSCTARKPKRENVEFFDTVRQAIEKGYRPCKICRPLETIRNVPDYIAEILQLLNADPSLKIKNSDLLQMDIDPDRVRRWFRKNHGVTFQHFQRMHRLNQAFKQIRSGAAVTETAFESGYESLSGFNDSFKRTFGVSPAHSRERQVIDLTRIETVLGTLIACATEAGICLLEFTDRKILDRELKQLVKLKNAVITQGHNRFFGPLKAQLDSYFKGELQTFDVPLDLTGTDFQKTVWEQLLRIPYGETRSYLQQAHAIGRPSAVRAVANANGMNKIAIIIPCHRVIGSDGSLTGYGGGLWRKKKLLELESPARR